MNQPRAQDLSLTPDSMSVLSDAMTERCDLAARSDFPCCGLMRDEWEGITEYRICEEHRIRMIEDINQGREIPIPEHIGCAVYKCGHDQDLHDEDGCRGRTPNHGFYAVKGTVACGCVRFTDDQRDEA